MVAAGIAAPPTAQAAIHDTTLVSAAPGGPAVAPNGESTGPWLTRDGRYVVFVSEATNLVAGDGNGFRDVFRRDTATGQTVLVSRADGLLGAPGNEDSGGDTVGGSENHGVSADGRYVVFTSDADNLALGDDNSVTNIFLRDLGTGQTEQVNVTSAEVPASGGSSYEVDISGDGRFVVFRTFATNLGGGGSSQVMLRDRATGTTTLVSNTPAAVTGNGDSSNPTVSDDGTRIAFITRAGNLGAPYDPIDDEYESRLVVRNLAANTVTIASRLDGLAGADETSFEGEITRDGKVVGWSNGNGDEYYVRVLATGATVQGSIGPNGARPPGFCCYDFRLSDTGRYLTIQAGDTPDIPELTYHRDLLAGVTTIASRSSGPEGAIAGSLSSSGGAAISGDGRFVAFTSSSPNLTAGDYRKPPEAPNPGQFEGDVFLRDVLGPPPPVDTTVSVQLVGKKVKLAGSRLRVKVACPAAEESGPCAGQLVVKTRGKVSFGGRTAKVKLAKGTFKVAAGDVMTIKVKLVGPPARRKALAALLDQVQKARKVTTVATVVDQKGNAAKVTKRQKVKSG